MGRRIQRILNRIKQSQKIQKIAELELERNFIHLFGGIIISVIIFALPQMITIGILALANAAAITILDKARTKHIPLISTIIERAERKGSSYPIIGSTNFIAGSLLAVLFLPKEAAIAGVMALSITDSFSTIFGKIQFFERERKIRIWGRKTLQGFVGGFLPCFLFFIFVVKMWEVTFFTALAASIIELICPIDDNLVLPISVGYIFSYLIVVL